MEHDHALSKVQDRHATKRVLAIVINGARLNYSSSAIGQVAFSCLAQPELGCLNGLDIQAFEQKVQEVGRSKEGRQVLSEALNRMQRETRLEPMCHPAILDLLRREPVVLPHVQRAFGILALAWVMSVGGFSASEQFKEAECPVSM